MLMIMQKNIIILKIPKIADITRNILLFENGASLFSFYYGLAIREHINIIKNITIYVIGIISTKS